MDNIYYLHCKINLIDHASLSRRLHHFCNFALYECAMAVLVSPKDRLEQFPFDIFSSFLLYS